MFEGGRFEIGALDERRPSEIRQTTELGLVEKRVVFEAHVSERRYKCEIHASEVRCRTEFHLVENGVPSKEVRPIEVGKAAKLRVLEVRLLFEPRF